MARKLIFAGMVACVCMILANVLALIVALSAIFGSL